LGAATGRFVDDLVKRYGRYRDHLFYCFDDERTPATTNELEGFFNMSKHALRQTLGCGSTSNSVVSNLGAEALIAHHQMRQPKACVDTLVDVVTQSSSAARDFLAARRTIAVAEAPATRQRSMVRHLDRHVDRLRQDWLGRGPGPPQEPYA
jgi:hypothetical protein